MVLVVFGGADRDRCMALERYISSRERTMGRKRLFDGDCSIVLLWSLSRVYGSGQYYDQMEARLRERSEREEI